MVHVDMNNFIFVFLQAFFKIEISTILLGQQI
jgi:hypothetical protein